MTTAQRLLFDGTYYMGGMTRGEWMHRVLEAECCRQCLEATDEACTEERPWSLLSRRPL